MKSVVTSSIIYCTHENKCDWTLNAIFKKLIFLRLLCIAFIFFRFAGHCRSCEIAIFTHRIYFSTGFFAFICVAFSFTHSGKMLNFYLKWNSHTVHASTGAQLSAFMSNTNILIGPKFKNGKFCLIYWSFGCWFSSFGHLALSVVPFTFILVPFTNPQDKLYKKPPPVKLASIMPILSLFLNAMIMLAVQVGAYILISVQDWYQTYSPDGWPINHSLLSLPPPIYLFQVYTVCTQWGGGLQVVREYRCVWCLVFPIRRTRRHVRQGISLQEIHVY